MRASKVFVGLRATYTVTLCQRVLCCAHQRYVNQSRPTGTSQIGWQTGPPTLWWRHTWRHWSVGRALLTWFCSIEHDVINQLRTTRDHPAMHSLHTHRYTHNYTHRETDRERERESGRQCWVVRWRPHVHAAIYDVAAGFTNKTTQFSFCASRVRPYSYRTLQSATDHSLVTMKWQVNS